MEYKVIVCIECNKHTRMSDQTFLCKDCFDDHARKLRSKYGNLKSYHKGKKTGEYSKWLKKAIENDVTKSMFDNRIYNRKMSYQEAVEMGRIRKAVTK